MIELHVYQNNKHNRYDVKVGCLKNFEEYYLVNNKGLNSVLDILKSVVPLLEALEIDIRVINHVEDMATLTRWNGAQYKSSNKYAHNRIQKFVQ